MWNPFQSRLVTQTGTKRVLQSRLVAPTVTKESPFNPGWCYQPGLKMQFLGVGNAPAAKNTRSWHDPPFDPCPKNKKIQTNQKQQNRKKKNIPSTTISHVAWSYIFFDEICNTLHHSGFEPPTLIFACYFFATTLYRHLYSTWFAVTRPYKSITRP